MRAVEVYMANEWKQDFTDAKCKDLQELTATELLAQALASGDANGIRDALRKKDLAAPVEQALQ
eukprot:7443539-Karenia_brevis.AAC.1